MARARESPGGGPREPVVYNDGPRTVTVRVVVDDRGVSPESVTLAPGESVAVAAVRSDSVTVHAEGGTATAPAATAPTFVVREASVLVAPE